MPIAEEINESMTIIMFVCGAYFIASVFLPNLPANWGRRPGKGVRMSIAGRLAVGAGFLAYGVVFSNAFHFGQETAMLICICAVIINSVAIWGDQIRARRTIDNS